MVETGIFCNNAEVLRKAGAGASSVSKAEAYTNDFISQAESMINVVTQYNWSDVYSTLNVDVKGFLKMAASAKAAQMVINYDTSGFTSREAETKLDVLNDEYDRAVREIKLIAKRDFINNA